MSTRAKDGAELWLLSSKRQISSRILTVFRIVSLLIFAGLSLSLVRSHWAAPTISIGIGLIWYAIGLRLFSTHKGFIEGESIDPPYVNGENLYFLSDGKKILKGRLWGARIVFGYLLLGTIGSMQYTTFEVVGGTLYEVTHTRSMAYLAGAVFWASAVYWVLLAVLSAKIE